MPETTGLRRLARLAAASLRGATQRYRARRALESMLRLDERVLHDIGMSRGGIVACLSLSGDEAADYLGRRCPAAGRAPGLAQVRWERLVA